ncbi:MAG: hypothetical protein AAGI27_13825, partial [Pseudomonadota bacterium]
MTNKMIVPFLLTAALLVGCGTETAQPEPAAEVPASQADTPFIWATNVGGDAYVGIDGVEYEAESSVSGGTVGTMDKVKGSQDPTLYQSFREGEITVDKA